MKLYHLEDMPYDAPSRYNILKLKSKGYNNVETAKILGFSKSTVKNTLYGAPILYGCKTWWTLLLKMNELGML